VYNKTEGRKTVGEERLSSLLPRLFRQTPIDELAKARLKQRLFRGAELSDDELSSVASAGDMAELQRKTIDKGKLES
jgi:hypothetical protein